MRQFDVYENLSSRSAARAPFLLVLPFKFFIERRTTVIAPLIDAKLITPIARLNPGFTIEEKQVILSPLELVNIPTGELTRYAANLASERDAIIGALDFLFTGV